MQTPLVSIIVPVFNVKDYLKECLESVINQTYKNLDIVFVDDESEDESLNICLEYAKKDERIFVISKPNFHQGSARNTGLEFIKGTALRTHFERLAQGEKEFHQKNTQNLVSFRQIQSFDKETKSISIDEINAHFKLKDKNFIQSDLEDINTLIIQELPERIIHFLDSDDYLKLDCIELCVNEMSEKNLEVFVHDCISYNETNQSFENYANTRKKALRGKVFKKGIDFLKKDPFYYLCWDYAFSTRVLNRYNLRFTHGIHAEDNEFGIFLYMLCENVYYLNKEEIVYRIRDNSTMTSERLSAFPEKLPKFLKPLRDKFTSYKELREYFRSFCLVVIAYHLCKFSQTRTSISRQEKALLNKMIFRYTYDYILYYSHLNYFNPQALLEKMGIELEKRRRFLILRMYWRNPKKLLPKFILKALSNKER